MTQIYKLVMVMLTNLVLTCATLMVTAGCATSEKPAVATNSPPQADVQQKTNVIGKVCTTNAAVRVLTTNVVAETVVTNGVPVKIIYPDVPDEDFCAEDWAEELAEKAAQGIHVKNRQVFVVVRIGVVENEYQSLTKLRAKFRALEFLRHHFPNLPKEFSAPCRVLVSEQSDTGKQCIVVMSFTLGDLQ